MRHLHVLKSWHLTKTLKRLREGPGHMCVCVWGGGGLLPWPPGALSRAAEQAMQGLGGPCPWAWVLRGDW